MPRSFELRQLQGCDGLVEMNLQLRPLSKALATSTIQYCTQARPALEERTVKGLGLNEITQVSWSNLPLGISAAAGGKLLAFPEASRMLSVLCQDCKKARNL